MRQPVALEVLWLCVALSEALLALRIWRLGLVSARPFLSAYLLSTLGLTVMSFVTRWYSVDGISYRSFWLWTQPLFWTLTLLVLVETYNHVLGRVVGFRSLGQVFLRGASVGVGGLYLWMVFSGSPASWFDFWMAHRWGLFVAAAVFFFLIAVFSKVLRVPLSANDQLVIVAFGLLVGGTAVSVTLREIWGSEVYKIPALVISVINLFTFSYAAFRFSGEGEVADSSDAEIPVDEAEMLENLDAMNRTIGKTLRK